jgi:hypothetical protein
LPRNAARQGRGVLPAEVDDELVVESVVDELVVVDELLDEKSDVDELADEELDDGLSVVVSVTDGVVVSVTGGVVVSVTGGVVVSAGGVVVCAGVVVRFEVTAGGAAGAMTGRLVVPGARVVVRTGAGAVRRGGRDATTRDVAAAGTAVVGSGVGDTEGAGGNSSASDSVAVLSLGGAVGAFGAAARASTAGCGVPSITPRLTAMGRRTARIPDPATITVSPHRGAPGGGGLRAMGRKLREDHPIRMLAFRDIRSHYV